jgi:diaminopimelate epimerase
MSQRTAAAIPFVKANACANDFLIIEQKHAPADIAAFTRRVCDRHIGVGADGVEWIEAGGKEYDVGARLINADGGEAELSGNGTRCVAAYWLAESAANNASGSLRVKTGAGIKHCKLVKSSGRKFEFEMNVGVPKVDGELDLQLASGKVVGTKIWMGNPQFVVFVEGFAPRWQEIGAQIQAQTAFPDGTNVDFVRMVNEHKIESRFFERGVGETQSSGTGSCASAVVAIVSGRANSPIEVVAAGGTQQVRWDGLGREVFLTGAAELVCKGEIFI